LIKEFSYPEKSFSSGKENEEGDRPRKRFRKKRRVGMEQGVSFYLAIREVGDGVLLKLRETGMQIERKKLAVGKKSDLSKRGTKRVVLMQGSGVKKILEAGKGGGKRGKFHWQRGGEKGLERESTIKRGKALRLDKTSARQEPLMIVEKTGEK